MSSHVIISKSRLDALVDGIFAIAMTILVLEIKVPTNAGNDLMGHLLHELPTMAGYVMGFLILGQMWYRQNHAQRHVSHITAQLFFVQLLQLAVAGFVPFCAALFSRYNQNYLAVSVYLGTVSIYAWAELVYWEVALRQGCLQPMPEGAMLAQTRRNFFLKGLVFSLGSALLFYYRG